MEELSEYYLNRWSRIVRIRDGHKCFLCEETADKKSSTVEDRKMHSHHIDLKSLFPEKAYNLDNGICLCNRCHYEIVHTTEKSHKKLRVVFKRHVNRKKYKEFNKKWQHKLNKATKKQDTK